MPESPFERKQISPIMNILSAEQIKAADHYTMEQEPVASLQLMERAARACFLRLLKYMDDEKEYLIFCGKGNNGGDGLALARMLKESKRNVGVALVHYTDGWSEDAAANYEHYAKSGGQLLDVRQSGDLERITVSERTLIIDAILGIGANRPLEGLLADTVDFINQHHRPVYAIDMPSGLYSDRSSKENPHIVRATRTFSFQVPKLAFMMAENAPYMGEVEIMNIGLHRGFIANQPTPYHLIETSDVQSLLRPRPSFSHKGAYGHALLIAGSFGKVGAAVIAARACMRSGCGLLTAHLPSCAVQVMHNSLPEAMVSSDGEEQAIYYMPDVKNYSAIGIGPGLGTDPQTGSVLKLLIQEATAPVVMDADALNLLSENKTWLSFLAPNTILTPHPKEFDRLTGAHTSDFDRLASAREFSIRYQCIVVLKGKHTGVVMPDGHVFFNATGNPAMAKGGSGDALTGVITGLLARGYPPPQAALIGVFVHGFAGDLCLKKHSMESVLASDLVEKLSVAFRKLYHEA